MPTWRPPTNVQQRTSRSVRSMQNGTLDGRVVGASRVELATVDNTNDTDTTDSTSLTLLPYTEVFQF